MKLPLAEISRRGVFKTLAAYTVASWVLIEVVSTLAAAFLLPDWTVAAATTIFVLGAFPALLFSWRYEISSDGIRREAGRASDEIDRFVRRISGALVVVLMGITAALWMNYFRAHSTDEIIALQQAQQGAPEIGEDGRIRSIAVMPFEDFSPEAGRRLLADGIPEAILHVLAQNEDVLVTARTSSFYFRDKDVTASEIGRILNVQALLEGSVQVSDDRLRVTSQLVRTADQGHIWSNVYEAPLDDVFEIQDTIAATVRHLILETSESLAGSHDEPAHPNLEAYELLLEAKGLLNVVSLEAAEQSVALLRLAIDISPEYADAYAWLTVALIEQMEILNLNHGRTQESMRDVLSEVARLTDQALELDPDNAIAILQKGQISQASSGGEGYSEAVQRALEAAPNSPDVLSWVAMIDYQQLNFQRARANLRRAQRVDPGNFEVLEQYLYRFCELESLLPLVETQLQNYSASTITALRLKSVANRCDHRYIDSLRSGTRLMRIDTEPASAVSVLLALAHLGDEEALNLTNEVHKTVPGIFEYPEYIFRQDDISIYHPNLADSRLRTFDWHVKNGANPYFFMIPYASLQIQSEDYAGAASSVAVAQQLWENYYSFRGSRPVSMDTLRIYALQAWLMKKNGEAEAAEKVARELQVALEHRGLDSWSGSGGHLGDTPLLILLLGGYQEAALDWLRSANDDEWLGIQPLLTSPMYTELREIPEATEILEKMSARRDDILVQVQASGLPEVSDPSLLIAKIESVVPKSEQRLGVYAAELDRDYDAAAIHFEKAFAQQALDPDLLADVLRFTYKIGDFELATKLAKYAVSQLPNEYFTHYELGFSHFWAGRWAKAIDSFQQAQRLDPESTYLFRWIGISRIMQGDAAGGMKEIQQLPEGWTRLVGLAIAYHALGQAAESDAALAELEKDYTTDGAFNIAYVLAFRGETDRAFQWLREAVDYRNRGLWSLAYQPLFKSIHEDPRWEALLRELGVAPEQLQGVSFDPLSKT
ncbi:MAG: tetratricopeptide repeat protein [Woeseiaceae bacterium]